MLYIRSGDSVEVPGDIEMLAMMYSIRQQFSERVKAFRFVVDDRDTSIATTSYYGNACDWLYDTIVECIERLNHGIFPHEMYKFTTTSIMII